MADDSKAIEEVMQLLEAEPAGVIPAVTAQPDIPALREQLAIMVSTGKAKEAIGVQLAHEQVKRLDAKRYETYVGGRLLKH